MLVVFFFANTDARSVANHAEEEEEEEVEGLATLYARRCVKKDKKRKKKEAVRLRLQGRRAAPEGIPAVHARRVITGAQVASERQCYTSAPRPPAA